MPRQPGPTSRMPRRGPRGPAPARSPARPGLGEAGGDHHETVHPGRGAVGDHAGRRRRAGTATTARSDGVRRGRRGYGGQPLDPRGARGAPGRPAREAAVAQVAQHGRAEAGAVGAGAVHGDAARVQQPRDRRAPRPAAPGRHCTDSDASVGAIGNVRCTTPSAYRRVHLVSGVGEDPQHRAFAGSTSATNRAMPVRGRGRGEVLQQHRADARAPGARPRRRTRPRPRRRPAPSRSYRPTAMSSSPGSATNASRSRWSTLTKRSRSRGGIRGYGEK